MVAIDDSTEGVLPNNKTKFGLVNALSTVGAFLVTAALTVVGTQIASSSTKLTQLETINKLLVRKVTSMESRLMTNSLDIRGLSSTVVSLVKQIEIGFISQFTGEQGKVLRGRVERLEGKH